MLIPYAGDALSLRRAFSCFPSGVVAVSALIDGRPVGLAASSFTTVSLDPPQVSLCVQHTSSTWPVIADAPGLGISVLGSGHDVACAQLGAKHGDRFAGLEWHATDDGAVLLDGASLWLDCVVHQVVTAGDHVIVLLRVKSLAAVPDVAPLVFHGSVVRQLAAVV